MGRLSMPQKRKRDDFFTVDRVWERKEEEDGTYRYLTSWKGFAEKTWEPIEHFTDEAIELVKDLERILDHPEEYGPKPQWLLDFEDQKARGVNVLKRTPGYNAKPSSSSRSASSDPQSKREKREDSLEGRRTGRQRGDGINYSDIARRRSTRAMSGQREESATPSRTMGRRVTELAATDRTPNGTPPPRSHQSSRASTRPAESDRAESEDEAMVTSRQEVLEGQKEVKVEDEPSSSSTIAADDAAVVKTSSRTLKVDVPIEMRVPLVISPPALASPNNLPAASPASTVLSASKIDSATGILLPLEPAEFPPFDWVGHIEKHGGEAAPLECFWKRRIDRFVNPFGDHIGKLLKVPDYDEVFTWEWCTVGTVIAVHGPWVQIHALDTDPVLAHWYMADDAGIQPFVTLSDQSNPKCKEPNKRRSTGNYKRMVERSMFDADGTDKRVPRECFEDQIPWKNRPVKNHFKVGYKLETYDPVRGEGCFYPATVVEVNALRELVKFHFDGYPESHTKIVSYNDYRLFPCGFAASIGWKCILPEGLLKKNENRGLMKRSEEASTTKKLEDKKKIEEKVAEKRKEDTIPEKKKNEEPPAKMARQKSPVITRPARQLSPLTIDDFTDEPIDDEAALPLTAYRYVHTGNQVLCLRRFGDRCRTFGGRFYSSVSSTSNSASHRQLPSTMHHTSVPLPAVPPTSRPVPAPAPPVNVDDLDRFLTQKVNLKTLTENEILEMLQAIGIPESIRVIFKQKKINWRALLGLTEDIMVEQLNIPRQWATTIDKYLEKNKSD
ncbi:hypothetical protein PRIPAC_91233 [Pristionchus pacificus]|uniref:Chromo domain-containing protein n=1 Tax=Pristionchus pacificus TaxID=54126 RepID=A0A2A6CU16_PRIPA|nr:hypothetical protein PRIPAC_91233 [Pristionchus pacificus]|eukprot:PDM81533.1 hypothetical protein PRIPAC_35409 [Pristionchus pacificus]